MPPENILIHVDNVTGQDNHDGIHQPVATAERAFSLLPPYWHGRAEIIFEPTGRTYSIEQKAFYIGMPIGPEASPLVIRGAYRTDLTVVAAADSSGDEVRIAGGMSADELIGTVLTRVSGTGSPVGTAISIRGNSAESISLQRSIGAVARNEAFQVERPAVLLEPQQTLNLTSHDGRSPNVVLIGIKIAPLPGQGLNLLNVRALCDTCEIEFTREAVPTDRQWFTGNIHTDSRIQGGIEDASIAPELDSLRSQAGVYIHGSHPLDTLRVVRNSILGGHLTFKRMTVLVSQNSTFVPSSLEALESPIQILAGGFALGQPSWGTATNKARIRNANGDGLRLSSGASMNSTLGPIHLDVYGCSRDGIRLDMGSWASFGAPGGPAGLVTTGPPNRKFGMNVRNASRALVGSDAALARVPPAAAARPLTGDGGNVALDDSEVAGGWLTVLGAWQSNAGLSLVRVNKSDPVSS